MKACKHCAELRAENNRLVTLLAARDGLNSRTTMTRIVRELEFFQAGKFNNATQISEALGVCTKTIHRDISFIRSVLRVPLKYDSIKNAWVICGEVDFSWFTKNGPAREISDNLSDLITSFQRSKK